MALGPRGEWRSGARTVFACGLSGFSVDSSSGHCVDSSSVVLGVLYGSLSFSESAQVCAERLVRGKDGITLEGGSLTPTATQII